MRRAALALAVLLAAAATRADEPLPPLAELLQSAAPDERVRLHELRFTGNSVIAAEELAAVGQPWLGRALAAEDLLELRDALSAHYALRGYPSSQAAIASQDVRRGVLEVQIVEGRLEEVEVSGNRGFSASQIAARFAGLARRALHVGELERELRVLQSDPRLEEVRAELVPGSAPGRSRLRLQLREAPPLSLSLTGGNGWSPAVGSRGAEISLGLGHPLGRGDELRATTAQTEGLQSYQADYSLPLNGAGTILDVSGQWSRADVIEGRLEELDIASRASSYRAGLRHPLFRNGESELWLGLHGELARARTKLLGTRFGFSPGSEDALIRTTVLDFSQHWLTRTRERVLALRSSFRIGLDALDATNASSGRAIPDASFLYWLGQAQWAQRLPDGWLATQLIARLDAQLSAHPLFPSEQLALGGPRTLRGYRRNRLVRDNGLIASLETRIPLLRSALGHELIQLAPFAELGHAWDDGTTFGPKTLPSAGLGLYLRPSDTLLFQLHYARPLRNLDRPGDDLQDHGLHFEATWLSN